MDSIQLVGSFLDDPNPNVRIAAVVALADVKPHYPTALPLLEHALTDNYVPVRLTAVRILVGYRDAAEPLLNPLRSSHSDPVRAIRWTAAEALANIAPDKSLVPTLLDAARTSAIYFHGALFALQRLGPLASDAIPELVKLNEHIRNNPDGSHPYRVADLTREIQHTILGLRRAASNTE